MNRFFLFSLVVSLAGCAELTAVRVTDDNPTPAGLPLYGTKPILVVVGQNAKIEYIPNLSERYALQLRTFLAKNDTTLTFNPNGTLSKSETDFDATAAISLFEEALGKIVPVQPTASDAFGIPETSPVRVFDFVFQPDGTVSLNEIGLDAVSSAFVPSTPRAVSELGSARIDESGSGSLKPIPDQ